MKEVVLQMLGKSLRRSLVAIGLVAVQFPLVAASKYQYLYKGLPFEMEVLSEPTFPDRKVSIVDFGGVGDGVTMNTQAFEKAMTSLGDQGGGVLLVPRGVWYTGPITFRSQVNLHLQMGAVVVFSSNFDDYKLIDTSFEGLDTKRCISPLNANGLENIAITGFGTIDGNGDAWRPVKRSKMTDGQWKSLTKKGVLNEKKDMWFPTAGAMRGALMTEGNFNVPKIENESDWNDIKPWLRPVLLSFVHCRGVYLQGVTFQNSPSWNLHPNMCENVILDGVTVRNPWYSQNGDGLDLESCTNAIIVNSTFDVGDDAICIKSGKDVDGRRRAMPCQNVIVNNCTVFHGHGGFVVGSEMSGGARNISVKNCQFLGTDVGLRFKSTRGRGGVVENIYIDNVNMINIPTEPLLFDLYYGGKSASEELEEGGEKMDGKAMKVTEETPVFKDIYIKNVTCRGARRAMFFNGLPEMPIKNIVIENTSISAEVGAELSEVESVLFRNVNIVVQKGPALLLNNARQVLVKEFSAPQKDKNLRVSGSKTSQVTLQNSALKESQSEISSALKKKVFFIK